MKEKAKKPKRFTSKEYSYTVKYTFVDNSQYLVRVPALPAIVTCGRTVREARLMARDAIRCQLEAMQKDGEEVPKEVIRLLLQEKMTISVA